MPDRPARIGIVTTGHGPRDEYTRYHREILAHLGAAVEIRIRHALDGLSFDELKPHIVGADRLNLGAHVHAPGATGNRMGPGWRHLFFDLDFCTSRMQRAIDLLEIEDRCDIIVLACAAEFPPGALASGGLMVHPRELLFSYVENLTWGTRRKVRVGVLVDREHADLDRREWETKPWIGKVDLVMAPIGHSVAEAAATLSGRGIDLAFFWGYGVGLVPLDPRDQVAALERTINAPLIVPHRATALFLRNLLMPTMDDRGFADRG